MMAIIGGLQLICDMGIKWYESLFGIPICGYMSMDSILLSSETVF